MASASGSLGFVSLLRAPSVASQPSNRRYGSTIAVSRGTGIYARFERPLEEIYNVRVERGVSKEMLANLGVERWSTWKTGKCRFPWDWHVDQQVYVVSGEVRVVPVGAKSGERYMRFVAGDLVRYPKWFEADLFFDGPYEERYRFRAYGDD
ncbi:uncharacterized protein LOC110109318 [Dendrobium catenatum]|uniref:(S)-ureidoglycine aminohydrolase cupin domain-containing protein n=1 Tax=Dendrobium catenatum TaxID=906689 RepID=A0A2I0WNM2_9ASPA|nr:uncharacterized protein LOC110109318 [Dendrobium catenatum]XP_020695992.1 uncharacterized protein LOC110109318 [Dendrobium catenatum]XP_020695993.1 uncharacterized protein LOC110109318 [Dendrobium catenatum]PKU77246.1 hypothetical protein MA16_Dca019653 [Dendrobium catenatum]